MFFAFIICAVMIMSTGDVWAETPASSSTVNLNNAMSGTLKIVIENNGQGTEGAKNGSASSSSSQTTEQVAETNTVTVSTGSTMSQTEIAKKSYDSTNYVQTGNAWFTPTCIHGDQVIICLPIVNMSPYTLKDIVVSPKLSGKDEDWPFEISQANYTIPVDVLPGTNIEPDQFKRTKNLYWTFNVREDVYNGYYKLDFQVLYTDELCNQGVNTISVYVDCVGAPGAKDKNVDEQLDPSTPRIIVTGFETVPAEVQAGQDFDLIIHLKNTSTETPVNNVQIDLTATESGKEANTTYATFLPTSGSNTAYFSSIPEGGTVDINMGFNAKSDLEQRPYVMKLAMKYENRDNKAYEGEASISIPVKQQSRFEISNITATPAIINVGYDSDVMFSVYNTGKTTLYNVKAEFIGDSINPTSAFVGNLNSGATGNIDCLVTGANVTMDDGTIIVRVSYEDEAGASYSQDYTTNIRVNSLEPPAGLQLMDMGEESGMRVPVEKESSIPKWLIPVVIIVAAIIIIVITVSIVRSNKKKKSAGGLSIEDLEDDED